MAAGSSLLWLACVMGAGGVGVLRYAWAMPRRVATANAAGWLLLLASVICAWHYAGAWGVSIAALVTTAAAFFALAVAGATSPTGRAPVPRQRNGSAATQDENRAIGRRVATFLLVMPGGCIAAIALGIAMRSIGTLLGWGEANANVAAVFAVPLVWAILAVVLLMQAHRRSQSLTLLGCALASAPFLLTGLGS